MALVGGASNHDWQWAVDDDVAPATSRSPSFVRIRSSEDRADDTLESLVVLEESPPAYESRVVVRIAAPRDPWGARDAELRVAALRLEEAAYASSDTQLAEATHALVADAAEIEHALRASVTRLGEAGQALLQHAYEWAANVLARAEALLEGRRDDDLAVHEYSSLFVRSILDPMLDAAIAAHARTRDARTVEELRALRERVFFMNWATKRLEAAVG